MLLLHSGTVGKSRLGRVTDNVAYNGPIPPPAWSSADRNYNIQSECLNLGLNEESLKVFYVNPGEPRILKSEWRPEKFNLILGLTPLEVHICT